MIGRTIQIRLTAEQRAIVARHVSASVAGHHAEECQFPGYRLCIDIVPGWGNSASLYLDDEEIDLGDIDLNFVPDAP